jgi:hypothetical protein
MNITNSLFALSTPTRAVEVDLIWTEFI